MIDRSSFLSRLCCWIVEVAVLTGEVTVLFLYLLPLCRWVKLFYWLVNLHLLT